MGYGLADARGIVNGRDARAIGIYREALADLRCNCGENVREHARRDHDDAMYVAEWEAWRRLNLPGGE